MRAADWVNDPADHHGEHEVAATIALGANDTIQADLAGGAEHGRDMAMRQAARDGKSSLAGANNGAAPQHTAQAFDLRHRPVGEVAQGAFAYLAILPIAFAQENGWRRIPVGDGFYIHGPG